jgi:hypothetical protein
MSKLTINTPSAEATAAANATFEVTDSKGRKFTLKKPSFLSFYALIKMLGSTAENAVYMSMVEPIRFVIAIDGEPVMPFNSQRELDALIQRVDEHGFMALADGISKRSGVSDAEADKKAAKK